jgi:3D (Asp-Asp-Asp) domain-containing protein
MNKIATSLVIAGVVWMGSSQYQMSRIDVLQEKLIKLQQEQIMLLNEKINLKTQVQPKINAPSWTQKVTVTSYSQAENLTASLKSVRTGTVAVSRDLHDKGWTFGKKIYLKGLGVFVINDLMNKRFTNRIDVFNWKEEDAKKFGIKTVIASLIVED